MTDRKPFKTGNENQLDKKSASNINVLLYLIAANQKTQLDNPARPPNQFNNAVFDKIDVKKYFAEMDGVRYPKDPIETNYSENRDFDQYRDLKLNFEEYNGESLFNPFLRYLHIKAFYPIQVNDLWLQTDFKKPKKIILFPKYGTAPEHTNL